MHELGHYKSITRPVPEFTAGQKVMMKMGDDVYKAAVVVKTARVWMTLSFDDERATSAGEFHMTTLKSRQYSYEVVFPELEEYKRLLREAQVVLEKRKVKLDWFGSSEVREQLTFYLADSLSEFFHGEDDGHNGDPD